MVTATSLWLDTLQNTAITLVSKHTDIYDALFIFTAAVCHRLVHTTARLLTDTY